LYTYIIIAAVIVSWLVGFGVINTYNQIARVIVRALHALTEPVFGPIRRILPPFGGLDLSPLIALLLIFFLQRWLIRGTLL
jgi:YggT family protein